MFIYEYLKILWKICGYKIVIKEPAVKKYDNKLLFDGGYNYSPYKSSLNIMWKKSKGKNCIIIPKNIFAWSVLYINTIKLCYNFIPLRVILPRMIEKSNLIYLDKYILSRHKIYHF